MLSEISEHLRKKLKLFFLTDDLIFNNKVIPIIQENFKEINTAESGDLNKTIAFVDGGQAEILSGGNLCLSFIRVFAQVMRREERVKQLKYEFYVLVMSSYKKGDIWYEGKIFPVLGESLVDEEDLMICSRDSSIRQGNERAPISVVANMARRFAELKLASLDSADHVLLDGTLTRTYINEENYLRLLGGNVGALAKSCTLFTTGGNNPMVLLRKLSPFQSCWSYLIENNSYFVRLNDDAKQVFRFEGNEEMFSLLLSNCSDALFLGYPYGLILADKLARVSNTEKNGLMTSILLREENREFADYLNTINAHDILDRMG